MKDKLAGVLVDAKIEPDRLLDLLKPKDVPAPQPGTPGAPPAVPALTGTGPVTTPSPVGFPKRYAPGRYYLSDGTKFQGTKEAADIAEAAVQEQKRAAEAKATLAETPEE